MAVMPKRLTLTPASDPGKYTVVKALNILEPAVGQHLTKREVEDLMHRRIECTIVERR